MLNQPMVEKLHALRLRGMADSFTQQQEDPQYRPLAFEERLALLVDQQWNWRQNRTLARRLKEGRLLGPACVEDINYRAARGLDRQLVRSLLHDSDWVRRHHPIFITGATGLGPVSRTGTGSGRRALSEDAPHAESCGCSDRGRLGDGGDDGP